MKRLYPISLAFVLCIVFLLIHCKKVTKTEATCSDGLLNQNEYWIDCGGACKPCETCSDGLQNQGETDVDCGGYNCAACTVTYPTSSPYGNNLLRLDTLTVRAGNIPGSSTPYTYSLKADIALNTSLKVRIASTGSTSCIFNANDGSIMGWTKKTSQAGLLEFEATGQKSCDVKLTPSCAHGQCKISYYLNSSQTAYRSKDISW